MAMRQLLLAAAVLLGTACSSPGDAHVALSGSGTANDPFFISPAPATCTGYVVYSAGSGVYKTHPGSDDIDVYCDMTHGGVTYEDFGFGRYDGTYPGWTHVGGPDFANAPEFDAAFSYLYNRQAGLTNIAPGFVSGNCCILNTTRTNYFGLAGGDRMDPGVAGVQSCSPSGGYMAPVYQLQPAPAMVVRASFTPAEAGTIAYSTICLPVNANPAIFVKRY